ncbi:hypothetical protein D0Z07_9198 [Hyphodiscus hymeniophilus]|uniref:Uncharacterized protein n=1 Tax=Hyphodiscus hymeniophilus TaxID=353542 RepID=A0A9P6SMD7_9HELO|nr:hypothetical protein D0Z07_9198 [Hyphodiscus hymeniophilus]
MPDYDLHKQYAKCMKKRSEGHAMYRNVSAATLKPGTCGYFDNDGDWQVIIQTTDAAELHKQGVIGQRVDLNVHAADGSQTVVAGGKLEFSSSKRRSAILIAEGVVQHNQATPATKLRECGSAQAQALIDLSGDRDIIKKKGFWIVTKTFSAGKCSISLLSSKQSKSSYNIDARTYGIDLSPSVEWWNSQKDEDWRDFSHVGFPQARFRLHEASAEHDLPDGVVMFMCGIWWRSRFLSKIMKVVLDKENQESLAGHTGPMIIDVAIQSGQSADPEYYQFTPTAVGEDKGNSLNLPQAEGSPYDDNDAASDSDGVDGNGIDDGEDNEEDEDDD